MFYIIYLLCLVSGALSVSVPFIKPCPLDDNNCILKSANAALPYFVKGLPEMGIESMDPMYIDKITGENAGLKLTFTDNYIDGLKTCIISNIKSEIKTKMSHTLTFKCSNIVINGNYNIDGQLIIFTINGNGKSKIDLRDVVLKVATNMTTVPGEDGKLHYHIENWRHSFKVLTGATFQLDNLFNGNKAIADPILKFFNENWKDVLHEAGTPIVEAIVGRSMDAAQKLYIHSSTDELYSLIVLE